MSRPNVLSLLLERESGIGAGHVGFPGPSGNLVGELERWVEDDMLEHTCADYVSFQPPPRSTIAVAYNADGSLLASSHGDHTVKITCCKTHKVLRSLTGHRRTPWAVRFHPRVPHLVASGSLDNEVRLWNARTGECFLQHTFGKPIASLSFHATAHVLGVACGHKVYMWEYGHALAGRVGSDLGLPPTPDGQAHSTKGPVIVLRTHRSVRAVAFHPSGENLLLSAEVQNPTATAGLRPSKTARRPYVSRHRDGALSSRVAEARCLSNGATRSVGQGVAVMDPNRRGMSVGASVGGGTRRCPAPPVGEGGRLAVNSSASAFWQPADEAIGPQAPQSSQGAGSMMGTSSPPPPPRLDTAMGDMGWLPPGSPLLPRSMVSLGWELPFPSASDRPSVRVAARLGLRRAQEGQPPLLQHVLAAFSAAAWNFVGEEQPARVRLRVWRYDPNRPVAPLSLELLTIEDAVLCSEMGVSFSPCGRYLAGVVACRSPVSTEYGLDHAATEEPEEDVDSDEEGGHHTVLDGGFGDPLATTSAGHHHRRIGDAVMQHEPHHAQVVPDAAARTSVMQAYFNSRNVNRSVTATASAGQHWSSGLDRHAPTMLARNYHTASVQMSGPASEPSGAYNASTQGLAAESRETPTFRSNANAGLPWFNAATTVANLPNPTEDQVPSVSIVSPTSPAAAAAAQAVVYEVRVFALRPSTSSSLGEVTLARRVHAAHCLTSVQFSPCSRHLLLAYGKRHFSLLRSLVLERSGLRPLHTIMEIVRLADARLQRVLPSSEDEINAACWHPQPGQGLVYGTKEGRLRLVVRGCDASARSREGRSSAVHTATISDTLSPFEPPGSDVLLSYVAQLAAVPAAVLREPLQAILRNAGGAPPQEDDVRPAAPPQPTTWGPWRPRGQQTANTHLSVGGQAGAAPQLVVGQMPPPPPANVQGMMAHQPRGWVPRQADDGDVGWLARPTGPPAGRAMTTGPQAYDASANLHRPFQATASSPVMATARHRRDHQQMLHHQQPMGDELANPHEELVAPPLRVAIDDTLRVDALGPSAWPIWPLFDGERWEERVAPTGARLARVAAFAERVLERLVAECMAPHEPLEPLLMIGGIGAFGVHRAAPSARLDVSRVREALLPALEAIWPPPEFVTPDLLASWAAYGRTYGIDPRWHWTCRWFWWTLRAWLESGGRPPGHRSLGAAVPS